MTAVYRSESFTNDNELKVLQTISRKLYLKRIKTRKITGENPQIAFCRAPLLPAMDYPRAFVCLAAKALGTRLRWPRLTLLVSKVSRGGGKLSHAQGALKYVRISRQNTPLFFKTNRNLRSRGLNLLKLKLQVCNYNPKTYRGHLK